MTLQTMGPKKDNNQISQVTHPERNKLINVILLEFYQRKRHSVKMKGLVQRPRV